LWKGKAPSIDKPTALIFLTASIANRIKWSHNFNWITFSQGEETKSNHDYKEGNEDHTTDNICA